jgi:hypothetical protein
MSKRVRTCVHSSPKTQRHPSRRQGGRLARMRRRGVWTTSSRRTRSRRPCPRPRRPEVQVDPKEDERPQDHSEDRRDDLLEVVHVREVVVVARDQHPTRKYMSATIPLISLIGAPCLRVLRCPFPLRDRSSPSAFGGAAVRADRAGSVEYAGIPVEDGR